MHTKRFNIDKSDIVWLVKLPLTYILMDKNDIIYE